MGFLAHFDKIKPQTWLFDLCQCLDLEFFSLSSKMKIPQNQHGRYTVNHLRRLANDISYCRMKIVLSNEK